MEALWSFAQCAESRCELAFVCALADHSSLQVRPLGSIIVLAARHSRATQLVSNGRQAARAIGKHGKPQNTLVSDRATNRVSVRLIADQFERQSGDHTARACDRLIVIGQTDLATERLTERAVYTNRVSVRLVA